MRESLALGHNAAPRRAVFVRHFLTPLLAPCSKRVLRGTFRQNAQIQRSLEEFVPLGTLPQQGAKGAKLDIPNGINGFIKSSIYHPEYTA